MVSPNPELQAVQLFACPACRAHKGAACETPAGRPRVPHDQRLEMIGLRQAEALKWQTFTGRPLVDAPDYAHPIRKARRT
jgi:hypothetical protein